MFDSIGRDSGGLFQRWGYGFGVLAGLYVRGVNVPVGKLAERVTVF